MQKGRGLGKGLSVLMGEMAQYLEAHPQGSPTPAGGTPNPVAQHTTSSSPSAQNPEGTQELPLAQLNPGKFQPRRHFTEDSLKELSESIRKNGVMQPILVRSNEGGEYEIIAGERRWRASKMAGKTHIPVIIKQFSDREALEFALIENIQREDLSPIEEAEAYAKLIEEFQYTQEELAHSVAKSRSHIANLLRLLQLPDSIKEYVAKGKISVGHARALIGHPDAEALAERIVAENASVREVEKWVQKEKAGTREKRAPHAAAPSNPAPKDHEIEALERQLAGILGMPVTISDTAEGGTVTIQFTQMEQLDTILLCLMSAPQVA